MSCCGGLNQILTLELPVLDQSDGTALDVSGLVGNKSFEISGTYSGSYTILGSNDGLFYVPLLTFNSGAGVQAFKQTTQLVMKFVKIRRKATILSPITISIAGASSLAESPNNFIALATVPAGQAVGPLPSVDLWSLVPATGLDAGFAVTCVGNFEGVIALEGSLNGIQFAPVGGDGGFVASPKAVGSSTLELSPIRIGEVIRFVRLNILVGTKILGPVNVALGGSKNAATGGGGNIPDQTIEGNNIGAPGPAIPLNAAQVRTVLSLAAIATSGSASDLTSGTLAVARIADGSLALTKLANIADQTILGNNTGAAGPPLPLTGMQARGIIGPATLRVANVAALAAVTATVANGYDSGSWAYVDTVGDIWDLQPSALAVDNITTVNATGRPGFQWIRRLLPNSSNATVATWSVDTTSGDDENAGTSDLTAVKTLQEIKRRLWGLTVSTSVTIRILTNTASTDVGAWNTPIIGQSGLLIIQGVLGASTGPGPTAHDNTIYTGSVTGFVNAANVPSADDQELTDAAIPASYTASGMLAEGVIFKRTNGGNLNWFAHKDLGAKTLRITNPMNNAGATTWTALAVNDTYSAFQMSTIFAQDFGPYALSVRFDSVDDEGTGVQSLGFGFQRRRTWIGGASRFVMAGLFLNCYWSSSGSPFMYQTQPAVTVPEWTGGGFRGTGTTQFSFSSASFGLTGIWSSQGAGIKGQDNSFLTLESEWAMHDYTGAVGTLNPVSRARFIFQIGTAGQGMSGKGNTGNLLNCTQGGSFTYAAASGAGGAAPPWNTASTTQANPISLGGAVFAVASLPTQQETTLSAEQIYCPRRARHLFTGALVTSAIGATLSYLANPGTTLAVANMGSAQRYPAGSTFITGLRVTVLSGVLTNAITVTLYKNNAATAMQVTIPAGTVANTELTDLVHPILFASGDSFDLRMDDAADASAGTMTISAAVEYPVG